MPPPSTDISNRPAYTYWSPLSIRMTAAPKVFSTPIVAVAPPCRGVASSAAAWPAPATITPVTASPHTTAPAVRRTGPRPRRDHAENEANTEFPSEQDPLTWGARSHQQNHRPREPRWP